MVSSLYQYLGLAGKVWNLFLPAVDKDPHSLCSICRGKGCNADGQCSNCHDWIDDMWMKLSAYRTKLAVQWEKDRKGKAFLPPFFSGFWLSDLPIPLGELSSSFDNAVVTSHRLRWPSQLQAAVRPILSHPPIQTSLPCRLSWPILLLLSQLGILGPPVWLVRTDSFVVAEMPDHHWCQW